MSMPPSSPSCGLIWCVVISQWGAGERPTATFLEIVKDGETQATLLEKPLEASIGVRSMAAVARGKIHHSAGLWGVSALLFLGGSAADMLQWPPADVFSEQTEVVIAEKSDAMLSNSVAFRFVGETWLVRKQFQHVLDQWHHSNGMLQAVEQASHILCFQICRFPRCPYHWPQLHLTLATFELFLPCFIDASLSIAKIPYQITALVHYHGKCQRWALQTASLHIWTNMKIWNGSFTMTIANLWCGTILPEWFSLWCHTCLYDSQWQVSSIENKPPMVVPHPGNLHWPMSWLNYVSPEDCNIPSASGDKSWWSAFYRAVVYNFMVLHFVSHCQNAPFRLKLGEVLGPSSTILTIWHLWAWVMGWLALISDSTILRVGFLSFCWLLIALWSALGFQHWISTLIACMVQLMFFSFLSYIETFKCFHFSVKCRLNLTPAIFFCEWLSATIWYCRWLGTTQLLASEGIDHRLIYAVHLVLRLDSLWFWLHHWAYHSLDATTFHGDGW